MGELDNFFCPNAKCPDYEIRGKGNITTSTRYGKNRTLLLRCKTCNHRFSENYGTVFMHSNFSRQDIQRIILSIAECNSIRGTSRILSYDKDAVNRVVIKAGEHCKKVLSKLIRDISLNECQLDELWAFVKKKKSLSEEEFEKEYGRHWIWASIDPESKLIINFFLGQRTLEDCRIFINDLISRIRDKPLFTSDELPHYETVLLEHFSHLEEQPRPGKRGRPPKPKRVVDPDFMYATVHKVRNNGKVVKVERNIRYGSHQVVNHVIASSKASKKINTSFIERVNLTLRSQNKMLARKTLCFAKRKRALEAQTNITVAYYNFSRPHGSLTLKDTNGFKIRRTPGMAARLINRVWPIGEILGYPMT